MDPNANFYDDLVFIHMDSNIKDHFTALFLPWHRWYLHTFEKALQSKCGYTGTLPFWDWSRDVNNGIPNSPVFSATQGFGGFGVSSSNPDDNYKVTTGPFASVTRRYPNQHIIKRDFQPQPFQTPKFPFPFLYPNLFATSTFTDQAIKDLVNGSIGNYTDFAYKLDGVSAQGMHNAAHLMIAGDLSNPLVSPNDPLFWLHHSQLDCIWARWQARRPRQNMLAYGGGLTQDLNNYDQHPVGDVPLAQKSSVLPTAGLAANRVTVEDVFVTWNAELCYKCDY